VSLSLIDSGGFGRITGRFIAWIMACGLAAISPAPIRHRAATLLRNATLRDDDIVSLIRPSLGFRRRPTRPAGLTDDELGRITVPTLAMFGEHSQLYDARATAAHLVAIMPTVQVQVVPGAGHDLLVYDPDLVADRIATFIPAAEALDH
jgi:pimeloyl-ACP methyl ester carboxylesterase